MALRLAGDAAGRAAHGAGRRAGSATAAASRPPGCSPGSGWRCSASGPGTTCRSAARADLPARVVPAQRLRLGLLGPADHRAADHRRRRCGRSARCRSALDELHDRRAGQPAKAGAGAAGRLGRVFQRLDRALHGYERHGRGPAGCARSGRRDPALRRVDHRPAGGRRLLGRHPAAVGVLADRAAPARLRARPPGDRGAAWPAWTGSPSGEDDPDGPVRRLEACQSPVWDTALAVIALRRRRPARRPPGAGRAAELAARRGDPRPRRLGGAPARARAGRLGVRVRQRQLPRHRRHRRGRAGAAPGPRCPAGPGRRRARHRRAASRWTDRHAVQGRRLGRLRRRQHPHARRPSCRSATSARSSTRRRPTSPRTSSRCSPPRAWPAAGPPAAASAGCCATRRPTARGSAAGAPTTSTAPAPWCPALVAAGVPPATAGHPARRRAGWQRTRTPTAAGARTCAPTSDRRAGPGRASPPRRRPPGRCSRCSPPGERDAERSRRARRRLARRTQRAGRRLGRAAVHRHRLPRRLLHQLPPLPAGLPGQRARPLPGAVADERPR